MDTYWNEKRPGDDLGPLCESLPGMPGGSGCLLMNPQRRPDWVRHPTTGDKMRVLDLFHADTHCHGCNTRQSNAQVLALEGDTYVYECVSCRRYIWVVIHPKGG